MIWVSKFSTLLSGIEEPLNLMERVWGFLVGNAVKLTFNIN
jgi:hypothetical protein